MQQNLQLSQATSSVIYVKNNLFWRVNVWEIIWHISTKSFWILHNRPKHEAMAHVFSEDFKFLYHYYIISAKNCEPGSVRTGQRPTTIVNLRFKVHKEHNKEQTDKKPRWAAALPWLPFSSHPPLLLCNSREFYHFPLCLAASKHRYLDLIFLTV